MSAPLEDPAPTEVIRQAAEWFACLDELKADPRQRQRWQAWLEAAPSHRLAWEAVERISGRFTPLRSDAARHALNAPRQSTRRRTLGLLVGMLSVGLPLLSLHASRTRWQALLAAHRTSVGETRQLALADAGEAWIGSNTAIDIDFTPTLRRLVLFHGDLLVHTAPDPQLPPRPFVVDTPHGRLRAVGTRFAVRSEEHASRVDVFEGAIEVSTRDGILPLVQSGYHATLSEDGITSQGAAAPHQRTLARGVIEADGLRLETLAHELARWHHIKIYCTPDVRELKLVGAYPINRLNHVLEALEASMPVRVERKPGSIEIGARPSAPYTPPRRASASG